MKKKKSAKIILASTSPRRIEMLKKSGVKFTAVSPGYEEKHYKNIGAEKLVKLMALGKARAAAKKYPSDVIITADTMVEFRGKTLGKPKNKKHAKEMLLALSGKMNKVYTAFAMANPQSKEIVCSCVATKVYFKKYSNKIINDYIATGEPMDKAGAYAVQGWGARLVKKISGDRDSLIGLPVSRVKKILKTWKAI